MQETSYISTRKSFPHLQVSPAQQQQQKKVAFLLNQEIGKLKLICPEDFPVTVAKC